MFLEVKNLCKTYGDKEVLKDINFSLEEGNILCILGPSGCGKTTILNSIGGFIKNDFGQIILNGEDISLLNPEDRNVSTVFQSYGLFNNKNVLENVAYGLKFRNVKKQDRIKKAMEILQIVGLNGYENRKVYELSGGQRQRVALARSLVINPRLILLDEPFSNLDKNLRITMRNEIKKLVKYFKMTTILVTHDQEDAFTMADRVILMNEGKIIQNSTVTELYNYPNSEFSLSFIGNSNKLDKENFIRPEKIKFVEDETKISAKIVKKQFRGSFIEYKLKLKDEKTLKVIELNTGKEKNIGDNVFIEYNLQKLSD
ncbi:ABC transporter ATP-binding protein [uncultured Parvimonas sp.]|uniref:ABC transporter ATP-binding protein n=1 Tax=uncultured Parvimonas sp. TaxID=747372 RepID=UPI0025917688|nr:ABC transporter ATP-binding protein [uncultured Parvimonas sp.]